MADFIWYGSVTYALIRITEVAGRAEPGTDMESVCMERGEMQRGRLRRMTDRGTDVGLDLPGGIVLRDGDLVRGDGVTILVRQAPETVGVVRPAGHPVTTQAWMLAAHAIGNMHRPVSVGMNKIIFPLQDEAERETFANMLERVGPGIFEIATRVMVFVPHKAADVTGHG